MGHNYAGTHHKPIGDCELCDQKGHMEGRLAGEIQEGKKPLIEWSFWILPHKF